MLGREPRPSGGRAHVIMEVHTWGCARTTEDEGHDEQEEEKEAEGAASNLSGEGHGDDEDGDEGSWMPRGAGSGGRDEGEDRHKGSEGIEPSAACKARYDELWWCKHKRLEHWCTRGVVLEPVLRGRGTHKLRIRSKIGLGARIDESHR